MRLHVAANFNERLKTGTHESVIKRGATVSLNFIIIASAYH